MTASSAIRARLKIPQRGLAALLGVSHSLVARWESENDEAKPDPSHLRLLALLEGVRQADVEREDWRKLLRESKGLAAFVCLVGP